VIQKVRYPLEFDGNWEMDYNDTFHEAVVEMYDSFWEIYSLRSNSWRKFNGLNIPVSLRDSSGVNLNEFCHWLGSTSDMVSFNFSNEMFSVTTLPSHSGIMQEQVNMHLGVLNECVSFVCTVAMTSYFHIWILGELNVKESWTKLFVVGPLTCFMRPIAVGIKSIIFCIKENLELAQIDLSTQTIEDIGFEAESICKQNVIYKENFLPFGGMDN
jgi:F-box interacting protein